MPDTGTRPVNRLINEKSPYLLQHAHNPVDWYPWGDEAFARAKREDKPVFLSIGYSTCHWCHNMEKESFADPEVAELLNRLFVAVKVDREERPDLDQLYMSVCQALTGQGGWPLTVILSPDKQPFFAGTYFPKHSRYGLPGLLELLPRLAHLWREKKERAIEVGYDLLETVRRQNRVISGDLPGEEILERTFRFLHDSFDERYGGFGTAPKFPMPHQLTFLLRYGQRSGNPRALEMAAATLRAMARGGIYDQLGFGFHRYATDARWLVPHFEKMLYDQALLALAYLEAFQATGTEEFALTAEQVFTYLLRDMQSPAGAFYTAEDADSEGMEGAFYVWSRREIEEVLGPSHGGLVAEYYGVGETGNFAGNKSVLHRPHDDEKFAPARRLKAGEWRDLLSRSREKLRQSRSRRPRPFRDEKIITAWNGLVVAALARGAAVLRNRRFGESAARAAAFIKRFLVREGRLMRRFREGEAAYLGYLDDYACLVWGLLELYTYTLDPAYLQQAIQHNEIMLALFLGAQGALNYVGKDASESAVPLPDAYDGAIPSGNAVAALNLLRLGKITGRDEFTAAGENIIKAFSDRLHGSPGALTFMLSALDFLLGPVYEVVLCGDVEDASLKSLAATVQRSFHPRAVLIMHPLGEKKEQAELCSPFIKSLKPLEGRSTAYICRDGACLLPVTDPAALAARLAGPVEM